MLSPQIADMGLNPFRQLGGLAARYDASDILSMTVDSAGRVSLLSDKSGRSSTNCLALDGVAGNTASSPDSAAVSQTGDQSFAFRVRLNDYTPGVAQVLFNHDGGASGNRGILVYINTDGKLHLVWSSTGNPGSPTGDKASTVAVPTTDLTAVWIMASFDVDNGASGNDIKFYTAPDQESLPTSWTQLGTTVTTAGATSVFNTTASVIIGNDASTTSGLAGLVYRAIYFSGIVASNGTGGTIVFDADFTRVAKMATSFAEFSSNAATVTINTTGATGARICGERDLYQGTLANQPVLLQCFGQQYGYLNAVSGNNFSTPDSAAVSVTQLEIVARIQLDDYTPTVGQAIVAKHGSAGNRGYYFGVQTDGKFYFEYSNDGTTLRGGASTVNPALVDRTVYWVRVTYESATGNLNFYYAADAAATPSSWTQIGTTVALTAGAIFDNNNALVVGSYTSGSNDPAAGRFYYAELRGSIGGAAVAVFNPQLYQSGATFVASTGETWTINGGATIVTKTGLYFDGSNDYMQARVFILIQPETIYGVGKQVTWTGNDFWWAGTAAASMGLFQNGTTPELKLNAGSSACSNTDLALQTIGSVAAVYNNTLGSLRVNKKALSAGTVGATAGNGFTLGAASDGTANGNVVVSEVAIFSAAHNASTQDRVAAFLQRRWGIIG